MPRPHSRTAARLFAGLAQRPTIDPRIRSALTGELASGLRRTAAPVRDPERSRLGSDNGRLRRALAGPRRRIIAAATLLALIGALVGLILTSGHDGNGFPGDADTPNGRTSPGNSGPTTSVLGLPTVPSELAEDDDMRAFVAGWDAYPGWTTC
jgi:hypothetical protein